MRSLGKQNLLNKKVRAEEKLIKWKILLQKLFGVRITLSLEGSIVDGFERLNKTMKKNPKKKKYFYNKFIKKKFWIRINYPHLKFS